MTFKMLPLRRPEFRPPPKMDKSGSTNQSVVSSPVIDDNDSVEKARPKKGRINLKKLAFQIGIAANSVAGLAKPVQAAAADMAVVQVVPTAHVDGMVTASDLAVQSSTEFQTLRRENSQFVREDFHRESATESLENFDDTGRLFKKTLGFKGDLTPETAVQRLYGDSKSIYVDIDGVGTYEVHSPEQLQELDTFLGLGLNPAESPVVVNAVRSLATATEEGDGLVRDGALLSSDQRVNSYEAYQALTRDSNGAGWATFKGGSLGAVIGTGLGVGLVVGGSILLPSAAPAFAVGGGLALGGAAAAMGGATGAAVAYASHKNSHPKELEVRQGIDRGLKIQTLEHAVEIQDWLDDRAANPFTEDQQREVARNFLGQSGLYRKGKLVTAEKALELLSEGKDVQIPSSIEGHSDTIKNLRELQTLDSLRGLSLNPVLPFEISESLRVLESGENPTDGLYKKGNFNKKGRLSAFEAANYLFRERQPIGVALNSKEYATETLLNIQELNALQGDGINTILPPGQFESLRTFDKLMRLNSEGTETNRSLDAYEALQEIRSDRAVRVQSQDRLAKVVNLQDFHELNSLEFSEQNEILDARDYDLLNHWQDTASFRVDDDGQTDRAYEALQAVQSGTEFEIRSAGRFAPAVNFQDMEDLATFEAPAAGFENNVPAEDFDRLTYFQETNEAAGLSTTRVDGRTGRAYEGYRELRDGYDFEVGAGGVWNTVTSSESLHDLDAMLGRQVNDILPQEQYDLLKHLGDEPEGEGLHAEGRVNSYGALQEFRAGRVLTYEFNGGDFSDRLVIETPNLESLQNTKELRDNQKEYDKYAYTVDEWRGKMERQASQTPNLADRNLSHGKGNLRSAESKKSRGQSDLRNAESDLRDAKSDLRYGEGELRYARSMPTTLYDWETKCDYEGVCTEERVSEHNYERDREISKANGIISRANTDIRNANGDIDSAERLIRQAKREITTAEGQVRDARNLLNSLPGYKETLSSTVDSNFSTQVAQLDSELVSMRRRSHISSLDRNIGRQQRLISNMETRPVRPDGWVVPDRLVQQPN